MCEKRVKKEVEKVKRPAHDASGRRMNWLIGSLLRQGTGWLRRRGKEDGIKTSSLRKVTNQKCKSLIYYGPKVGGETGVGREELTCPLGGSVHVYLLFEKRVRGD